MTDTAAIPREALVKSMVDRFLAWPLPADFHPDNGISAARPNYGEGVEWRPVGTNLLTAAQAEAMIRHLLGDHLASSTTTDAAGGAGDREAFLSQLRRVNTDRYHAWVGNAQDAGILFDAAELGGEVGELLNVVKKLEREERGWRGSRAAPEDFADECADVLICLDKLARRRGVDLEAATVAKFNATSEKVGLPHKLVAAAPAIPVAGAVKWRERWYGSDPQQGSAITDERGNLIAYFGGDNATHAAVTKAVAVHNATIPATGHAATGRGANS